MTPSPLVKGDYDSEDYSEWTEVVAPADSNLVESSVYYGAFPRELNEEYMSTATATPAREADKDDLVDETIALNAVEAGATFGSEIPIEDKGEDMMSEWSDEEHGSSNEEEVEEVISEGSTETWVDEDGDLFEPSKFSAGEDEVEDLLESRECAGETMDEGEDEEGATTEGFEESAYDFAEPSYHCPVVDEETWVPSSPGMTLLADSAAAEAIHTPVEEEEAAWAASEDAARTIDQFFAEALDLLFAEIFWAEHEAAATIDEFAEPSYHCPVIEDETWVPGSPRMTLLADSAMVEANATSLGLETWIPGSPGMTSLANSLFIRVVVEEEAWFEDEEGGLTIEAPTSEEFFLSSISLTIIFRYHTAL